MITLITATLPERARLFAQLAESVSKQSLPPAQWLVQWDFDKVGPIKIINGLAEAVDTDWLFRVDDDDLLEADHFDALRPYLNDDADIVYSWCRVEGKLHTQQFQQPFDAEKLRRENYIPSSACIRTSLWHDLGGYREGVDHEDHDLWVRALDAGARFACVPIVTWRYRLGGWQHRSV